MVVKPNKFSEKKLRLLRKLLWNYNVKYVNSQEYYQSKDVKPSFRRMIAYISWKYKTATTAMSSSDYQVDKYRWKRYNAWYRSQLNVT